MQQFPFALFCFSIFISRYSQESAFNKEILSTKSGCCFFRIVSLLTCCWQMIIIDVTVDVTKKTTSFLSHLCVYAFSWMPQFPSFKSKKYLSETSLLARRPSHCKPFAGELPQFSFPLQMQSNTILCSIVVAVIIVFIVVSCVFVRFCYCQLFI